MARRGGKGTNTKAGLVLRKKGRRPAKYQDPEDDDEDFEYEPKSLEPEHSSVEPIDDDDDFEPEEPVMVVVPPRPRSKRSPPSDKGKEEADDNRHTTRSKRHRYRSPPPDDEDAILVEASDDDHDAEDDLQQDEPRTETVTLDQLARAATTNIAYLNALVGVATYYETQLPSRPGLRNNVLQVLEDMEDTLRALRDCPMPITQVAPIEHAVPPTIPYADGSELRFTNVAQSLGISWRDVPEAKKKKVYARAVELHRETYGCVPVRKLMHTSAGIRGVYYYNESNYRPTMLKALVEFKKEEALDE